MWNKINENVSQQLLFWKARDVGQFRVYNVLDPPLEARWDCLEGM